MASDPEPESALMLSQADKRRAAFGEDSRSPCPAPAQASADGDDTVGEAAQGLPGSVTPVARAFGEDGRSPCPAPAQASVDGDDAVGEAAQGLQESVTPVGDFEAPMAVDGFAPDPAAAAALVREPPASQASQGADTSDEPAFRNDRRHMQFGDALVKRQKFRETVSDPVEALLRAARAVLSLVVSRTRFP
eukprot:9924139-Heterocapsa_arctica.AAC.1